MGTVGLFEEAFENSVVQCVEIVRGGWAGELSVCLGQEQIHAGIAGVASRLAGFDVGMIIECVRLE